MGPYRYTPRSMVENKGSLRVAIVGGGTVGLSLALYLHQLEICNAVVYEAAPAFGTIGAGIEISHNGMKAYNELGLASRVYDMARTASGDSSNVWFDVWFGDGRNHTNPIYTRSVPVANTKLHRADALDLLVSSIPSNMIQLGKRLENFERTEGGVVTLDFTDGTTAEADVLIGADGIKSRVRQCMYGGKAKAVEPVWSGGVVYRCLLPLEIVASSIGEFSACRPNLWMGRARHIIQYPVSRGKAVSLGAFVTDYDHGRYPDWKGMNWVEEGETTELLEEFKDFSPSLQTMLKNVTKPLKWAIFELPPLPSYVSGNTALVGDAAHAATPHQGNGASQGIEDAHVLGHLLSHPLCTRATVPLALKAYDAVRRPRSQRLQETSYEAGRLYECVSDADEDEVKIGEAFETMMDWIWNIDIDEQKNRAVRMFEESLQNLQEFVMTE